VRKWIFAALSRFSRFILRDDKCKNGGVGEEFWKKRQKHKSPLLPFVFPRLFAELCGRRAKFLLLAVCDLLFIESLRAAMQKTETHSPKSQIPAERS